MSLQPFMQIVELYNQKIEESNQNLQKVKSKKIDILNLTFDTSKVEAGLKQFFNKVINFHNEHLFIFNLQDIAKPKFLKTKIKKEKSPTSFRQCVTDRSKIIVDKESPLQSNLSNFFS